MYCKSLGDPSHAMTGDHRHIKGHPPPSFWLRVVLPPWGGERGMVSSHNMDYIPLRFG